MSDKLKTKWSEITLKEQTEMYNVINSNEIDVFKYAKIISILSGKSLNAVEQMPYPIFEMLINDIKPLFEPPKPSEVKRHYIINDKDFVFISNIGQMSVRSYVDTISLLGDVKNNISKILATFLLPANKVKTFFGYRYDPLPYGSFDVNESNEYIYNNILAVDAMAISAFFLKNYNSLMNRYLRRAIRKTKKTIIILSIKKMIRPSMPTDGLYLSKELLKKLLEIMRTF